MNRCITIGREFGSGGREVAKRLADELDFAYYDNEIIRKIAEESGYSESVINKFSEAKITRQFPITFGRTFTYTPMININDEIFIHQKKIIKGFANTSNCIIVGRCADRILDVENPFKVFIYSSDMSKRVQRCYDKVPDDKHMSEKEMQKHILKVDKGRADYYNYYTDEVWGKMQNYNLCIDTAVFEPKEAVKLILKAIEHLD